MARWHRPRCAVCISPPSFYCGYHDIAVLHRNIHGITIHTL